MPIKYFVKITCEIKKKREICSPSAKTVRLSPFNAISAFYVPYICDMEILCFEICDFPTTALD